MRVDKMYERLDEQGYIGYGITIPIEAITHVIGKSIEDGWEFLGPYIELKDYIEREGYFCSSRGTGDSSLRILSADEMADRAAQIWRSIVAKQKKSSVVMSKADTSELTEYQRCKHNNEVNKICMHLQSLNSVLQAV